MRESDGLEFFKHSAALERLGGRDGIFRAADCGIRQRDAVDQRLG